MYSLTGNSKLLIPGFHRTKPQNVNRTNTSDPSDDVGYSQENLMIKRVSLKGDTALFVVCASTDCCFLEKNMHERRLTVSFQSDTLPKLHISDQK